MGNSLPCRRQIPLRKAAKGERERSFSNSKFEDEGERLQCAEGKVARGRLKGDFRGVQEVVGGMRRRRGRRRVVVRWRGERERCIFLVVVVVVGGGGGGVIKILCWCNASRCPVREIYISNPPQKLCKRKSGNDSELCLMTFF